MKPKVLVTGAGGNIGIHIVRLFGEKCEVVPAAHEHIPRGMAAIRLDITDADGVSEAVARLRPDAVVNAAAMADAGMCERNLELAKKVNITGAVNVAAACAREGAHLVHFSTDLVFDGRKGMYTEDDTPNPLGVYAETKLESEKAALSINPETAVLRTAIVYGPGSGMRKSFFESAIAKARSGETVKVFTDQYRSFMYIEDCARAALALVEKMGRGVYHAGGAERLSRSEFMLRVFRRLGIDKGRLEEIGMSALPDKTPRPEDCSLDSGKIAAETGWRPSTFEQTMARLEKYM